MPDSCDMGEPYFGRQMRSAKDFRLRRADGQPKYPWNFDEVEQEGYDVWLRTHAQDQVPTPADLVKLALNVNEAVMYLRSPEDMEEVLKRLLRNKVKPRELLKDRARERSIVQEATTLMVAQSVRATDPDANHADPYTPVATPSSTSPPDQPGCEVEPHPRASYVDLPDAKPPSNTAPEPLEHHQRTTHKPREHHTTEHVRYSSQPVDRVRSPTRHVDPASTTSTTINYPDLASHTHRPHTAMQNSHQDVIDPADVDLHHHRQTSSDGTRNRSLQATAVDVLRRREANKYIRTHFPRFREVEHKLEELYAELAGLNLGGAGG